MVEGPKSRDGHSILDLAPPYLGVSKKSGAPDIDSKIAGLFL